MRLSLPAGAQEALVLDNGTVGYGGGLENLITGATLTVSRGDRLLIVGPNGAGKSTLLRTLGGALRLQGGSLSHGRAVQVDPIKHTLKAPGHKYL